MKLCQSKAKFSSSTKQADHLPSWLIEVSTVQRRIPRWPRERFHFFHPPPRCRIKITTGTYLLSPKDRTSPGETCRESKVLSKVGLPALVVEAKLTFSYPVELMRRTYKQQKNTSTTSIPAESHEPSLKIEPKSYLESLLKGNLYLAHRSGIL